MNDDLTFENVDWSADNELDLGNEDLDVEPLDDTLEELTDEEDNEEDEIDPILLYGSIAGGLAAAGGLAYLICRIRRKRIRFRSPIYFEDIEDDDIDLEDEEEDETNTDEEPTSVQKETSKKRLRKKKRRK